ncbi:MAG: glycosyltransferase [Pseudomonadota bacterium]|nr:glycosyltransferase [Pseudomonadota bacterium]
MTIATITNISMAHQVHAREQVAPAPASQPVNESLPLVSRHLLNSVFQSLSGEDTSLALEDGIVPIAWLPYQVFYAQKEGSPALAPGPVVGRIAPAIFDEAVERIFARRLARRAALGLAKSMPLLSAHHRFTGMQAISLFLLSLCLIAGVVLLPHTFSHHFFGVSFSVFFSTMIWLRLLALSEPYVRRRQEPERDDSKLPIYTVLVPLFRETAVLPQIVAALCSLNYPTAKLDIKLIIEEKDGAMRRATAQQLLPKHFQVLVVPAGRIQTKPRALNYALNFARGSLVTIYDAEDIPEPMQLRMAAKAFGALPENYACLQAELSFYNPNENWLTRQFTTEYATLFKLILPALSANQMPIPLGGTSNHFRKKILQSIGGWDAHNVTEDADLGFRLSRLGYQSGMLNSTTFEEATTQIPNWVHQRARWFKGFLQTWLVHMRQPIVLINEIGFAGFMTMQATILGVVLSAAIYPIFLGTTIFDIGAALWGGQPIIWSWDNILGGIYIALFCVGSAVMIYSGAEALQRKHLFGWGTTLATMPLYWLLASIAAWLSVWQLATNPFYWNKTRHGLSSLVLRPKAKMPIST